MKSVGRCYPIFLLLFGVLFSFATATYAAQLLGSGNGVNDHPHNLSSDGLSAIKSSTEDRICVFCHTPHGGSSDGPLWNRDDPAGPFPLAGRASLDIKSIPAAYYSTTPAVGEYPNGSTRLCLSCHDGVTAIGQVIVGGTLDAGLGALTGDAVVDLSTSHPVSFFYNATVLASLPASFSLPAADSVVNVDAEGRLQCTTCHDPHNDTNNGTYTNPMWRHYSGGTTAAESDADYNATCTTCHNSAPALGQGIHGSFGL